MECVTSDYLHVFYYLIQAISDSPVEIMGERISGISSFKYFLILIVFEITIGMGKRPQNVRLKMCQNNRNEARKNQNFPHFDAPSNILARRNALVGLTYNVLCASMHFPNQSSDSPTHCA